MNAFTNRKEILLILEDGNLYNGYLVGHYENPKIGEVVFQTSMTGYQEIITDPSYKGQIVIFTYPSIGNYGTNKQDIEFQKPLVEGIVIKEYYESFFHYRSSESLETYLKRHKIPCICNLDTRKIVRHIREKGAMRGGLFLKPYFHKKKTAYKQQVNQYVQMVKESPLMKGRNLVGSFNGEIAGKFAKNYQKNYNATKKTYKIGILDFGVKYSIIRELIQQNMKTIIFSGSQHYSKWNTSDINQCDGFLFSNGPGDPESVKNGIENIQYILSLGKNIFAICLGHQLLLLALDLKTFKMKFGHHGGNQPSFIESKKKVLITSQNHGFSIQNNDSIKKSSINGYTIINKEINPNDNTIEGFFLQKRKQKIISIQYHPEAGPGPNDAKYLFEEFYKIIDIK